MRRPSAPTVISLIALFVALGTSYAVIELPAWRMIFAVGETIGGWASRVDVTAGGEVLWIAGGVQETDFTSLSTISFWTD